MQKAVIQLEPMVCPSCANKIESAIKTLEGVEKNSISVLFNSSKVKLEYDESKLSLDEISKTITSLGYEVLKSQVKS